MPIVILKHFFDSSFTTLFFDHLTSFVANYSFESKLSFQYVFKNYSLFNFSHNGAEVVRNKVFVLSLERLAEEIDLPKATMVKILRLLREKK